MAAIKNHLTNQGKGNLCFRFLSTFGFPFCRRLWDLTKRRDDIAVADMGADMVTDMKVQLVADMKVDKVADIVDMVADKKKRK